MRAAVATDVTSATLPEDLRSMVDPSATLYTDERPAYRLLGREFAQHETVNHSEGVYVHGDVFPNTIEGLFGIL